MFGFSDETYIDVASGDGGGGAVSFRREKYVPKGGPDGGDGGRGGDVVFVVKNNLRTLQHLKLRRVYKAQNGESGRGARCHGRDGESVEIPVPPGTIIRDASDGTVLKDFTDDESWVYLTGGRGGKGNWHFRTSRRQTPRFAQPGMSGEQKRVHVELRIIADIGFVGFPNAGKSSLLNYLTNANSKVADYPFTTKIPHLGVFKFDDRDIILADIPGILEGASEGTGLGLKFLRHIARTEALAYLIDASDDRYETAFMTLQGELASYSPELAGKRRVLVLTKTDLPEAAERAAELARRLPDETILPISVYSGEGITQLRRAFRRLLTDMEKEGEKKDREG
jgi:GTPase